MFTKGFACASESFERRYKGFVSPSEAFVRTIYSIKLNKIHSHGLALRAHLVGPYTCLYLADVGLVEEHHTQAALTDTSADALWQLAVEQLLVEIELQTLFLVFDSELAQEGFLVHTDTH